MKPWEELAIVAGSALGVGFLAAFAIAGFAKAASASTGTTGTTGGTTPQPSAPVTGATGANYIVTPLSVGQTFNLHVGDTLTFELPVPPTGDTWGVTPSDPSSWDQEGTGVTTNSAGLTVSTIVYSPTKTGTTTLTMALTGSANYQIGTGYVITANVT
jgi:hypothetical protein